MNPGATSGTTQQRKRGGGGGGEEGGLCFISNLDLKKEIITKETVQFIYNFPLISV